MAILRSGTQLVGVQYWNIAIFYTFQQIHSKQNITEDLIIYSAQFLQYWVFAVPCQWKLSLTNSRVNGALTICLKYGRTPARCMSFECEPYRVRAIQSSLYLLNLYRYKYSFESRPETWAKMNQYFKKKLEER